MRRPRSLRSLSVLLVAFAAASTTLLTAHSAEAGPFSTIGYDPESSSLASGNVAYGRSLGVMFTNPSLLTQVPRHFTAGLIVTASDLHVKLMPKPRASDVPISIYDSDIGAIRGLKDRALPTVELARKRHDTDVNGVRSWFSVGGSTEFALKGLRVGALVIAPLTGSDAANVQTHFDDEREAAFSNRVSLVRFGQWDRILAMIVGAGYQPTSWLAIGAAAQFSASAVARVKVYIPDAAVQSEANTTLSTSVSTAWKPVIGARIIPTDNIAIGLVWRGESYIEVDGASEVQLWNYHEPGTDKTQLKRTTQRFPVVVDYEPMEVSASLGAKLGPATAQATLTWQQWSHYLDQHGIRPQDVAVLPTIGSGTATTTNADRFAFHNTLAVHGGVQVKVLPDAEVVLGGAYRPSPVPAQTGRTNYADGDLVALTLGQRCDLKVFGVLMTLSTSLQLWHMLPRTTHKDPAGVADEFPDSSRGVRDGRTMTEAVGLQTNNPGYPGYTTSGMLLAGAASISHTFLREIDGVSTSASDPFAAEIDTRDRCSAARRRRADVEGETPRRPHVGLRGAGARNQPRRRCRTHEGKGRRADRTRARCRRWLRSAPRFSAAQGRAQDHSDRRTPTPSRVDVRVCDLARRG